MKLIDAFIFYNEEKMLDFRLDYYKDIVDYFVIVEARQTFSGKEKKLHFEEIKEKYSHLPIIHYVIDTFPDSENAWSREHYQRQCIKNGLELIPDLEDNDWVLISDVDEIADRNKLCMFKYPNDQSKGYILEFDMYYYNLTCKMEKKWYSVKICRYSEIKEIPIQNIRFSFRYYMIPQFGWHFSYFFTPEMIKNKIEGFSHQEYNNENYTNKEYIEDCIQNGKDLFHLDSSRNEKIIRVPIHENTYLPEGYEYFL